MSTEADIVERLRARCVHPQFYDGIFREAADLITKLRAEHDAAARDMRERCGKVADGVASGWSLTPGGLARQDAAEDIAERIRALPEAHPVIATSGKDAT